jgi:DNA-binding transcriptional LysR family regulator
MENLNSDLLRTFLAVSETGSISAAAERVSRSQSATSLQIGKLETIVGQHLFKRHGRGVVLTRAGERLLPVARDVTRMLDTTLREMTSDGLSGLLRLGIPDDQRKETLSKIIGNFAQSHPLVELEVICQQGTAYAEMLTTGALDLAIFETAGKRDGQEVLRREHTFWMTSRHHDLISQEPIPVALFDRDCWWRDVALDALRKMARPYRIVFSSQSVAGVAAAIEAGVAIGLLGETSGSTNLRRLGPEDGFNPMPISTLVMARRAEAEDGSIVAMERAIRDVFATTAGQA